LRISASTAATSISATALRKSQIGEVIEWLREIAGRFPLPWTLLAAARFCRNSVMTSFAGNRCWNFCGRLGANSATALRTVWARASVGRPHPTRRR